MEKRGYNKREFESSEDRSEELKREKRTFILETRSTNHYEKPTTQKIQCNEEKIRQSKKKDVTRLKPRWNG